MTHPRCSSQFIHLLIIPSCNNSVNNIQCLQVSAIFSGRHQTMRHFELNKMFKIILIQNWK